MTTTETQQHLEDCPDEVVAVFESADGAQKKTAAWRVDDYRQRFAAGQWPMFCIKIKPQLEDTLGPGYRQVSATLNGEPLADVLVP